MRITGVAVMAAVVETTIWAGALPVERQVNVCMANTDIQVENRAKAISSGIFTGIGVKI